MTKVLSEKYIHKDGMRFVSMLVPKDITDLKIRTYTDYPANYRGRGFPYEFLITLYPSDYLYQVGCFSPRHYVDDYLENFDEETVDDYGTSLRHYNNLESYLDEFALFCNEGRRMKVIKTKDRDCHQKQEQYLQQLQESFWKEDPLKVLEKAEYRSVDRVYSYISDRGTERYMCYSATVKACAFVRWAEVPGAGDYSPEIIQMVYPNAYFDKDRQTYMYTTEYQTVWDISNLLVLSCEAADFPEAYADFDLIVENGVTLCPDILLDFRRCQEEIDAANRARREEKSQVQAIQQEYAEEKSERDRQLHEYLMNTQQQINEIHNSAYEHTRDTIDRTNEHFSDTFRGDTRFVDRHGNEHVIHTTDDHVYKSGNTYVTSDTQLSHGPDWEELQKKKY